MKKILIVSYFYPPCRSIASLRPYSFAREFKKKGYDVTVITRAWSGQERTTSDYSLTNLTFKKITEDGIEVIYLPYKKHFTSNKKGLVFRVLDKVNLLIGNFDSFQNTLQFKKYLFEYLKANTVDLAIVTALPHNIVKLSYFIRKKAGIPVIVDFRDLNIKLFLEKEAVLPLKYKYIRFLTSFYFKKWINGASLVTSVSSPIGSIIQKMTGVSYLPVCNGYEEGLFDKVPVITNKEKRNFNFTVIGTLNPMQDIHFMLKGLSDFVKGKDDVKLNFIGLKDVSPLVSEIIQAGLPAEVLNITERIPREETLKIIKSSEVLYHIGWKGYSGIYSGKVFEYLGSHKNILIAPNDQDVLEELITRTGSGKLADTPAQMTEILDGWYEEWKQSGEVKYNGKLEEINKYTRENQARLLVDFVEDNIL